MTNDRPQDDRNEDPNEHPSADTCAICGRELWSDGLATALDGDAWICGDRDQARSFTALDP